jgi:hypothetical protein
MRKFLASFLEVLEIAIIAVAAVFIVRTFLVQPFLVSGTSMYPTTAITCSPTNSPIASALPNAAKWWCFTT